jgi:anti-sigma-K factor RskA
VIALGIVLANLNTVNVVHTYACAVAQPRADGNSFTTTGCTVRIRSNHTVEVAFNNLPRLNAQQAYELWALPAKGNPVPVAGITTGGAFNKIYPIDPARYAKAAISIEQAPGNSTVPHGPIVFVLPLSG